MHEPPPTIEWQGTVDGKLLLLDQTKLPAETVAVTCHTVDDVWHAIKQLQVRGAPAIGIAAAYGICVAVQPLLASDSTALRVKVNEAVEYLATSRPTAVNLFWALERMRQVCKLANEELTTHELAEQLLTEAKKIHEEDRQQCLAIGEHGAKLLDHLPTGAGILTHCNAGALATGGDGTALAVIFALATAGKRPQVYADETRPLLQGARLTTWELMQREIDVTLICDSMAAQVMREGKIQAVVTGADRIAANGDVANKIGTYSVALAAKAHDVPFYVAAPSSTFDLSLASGDGIPIENRDAMEITHPRGTQIAPTGVKVYNPAFDVTPAGLIAGLITERGVITPVNAEQILRNLS